MHVLLVKIAPTETRSFGLMQVNCNQTKCMKQAQYITKLLVKFSNNVLEENMHVLVSNQIIALVRFLIVI